MIASAIGQQARRYRWPLGQLAGIPLALVAVRVLLLGGALNVTMPSSPATAAVVAPTTPTVKSPTAPTAPTSPQAQVQAPSKAAVPTLPPTVKVGPALAAVQKAGKLLVAIDATYPPMESEDNNGKPAGFDIDFTRELARRLGVTAEFIVMSWDGITAGLASKRYDVIISTMNITPEREQQVDFVEYLRMSQVFVSKDGLRVEKEADLAGKIVAVQADTTSADYVEKAKKHGVRMADVKAFKLAPDAFAALRAKQAEVIVIDEPVAKYFALADKKTFQITGRAMAPEPIGIATRKADKDLSAAIAGHVAAMRQDGTLKKLQLTWFGSELGAGAG